MILPARVHCATKMLSQAPNQAMAVQGVTLLDAIAIRYLGAVGAEGKSAFRQKLAAVPVSKVRRQFTLPVWELGKHTFKIRNLVTEVLHRGQETLPFPRCTVASCSPQCSFRSNLFYKALIQESPLVCNMLPYHRSGKGTAWLDAPYSDDSSCHGRHQKWAWGIGHTVKEAIISLRHLPHFKMS